MKFSSVSGLSLRTSTQGVDMNPSGDVRIYQTQYDSFVSHKMSTFKDSDQSLWSKHKEKTEKT